MSNIRIEIERLAGRAHVTSEQVGPVMSFVASKQLGIDEMEARALIKVATYWFREACLNAGYDESKVRALTTKFRDAGRRSAPWKPTSSRVPGRPQDGSDGNRISRWLLPEDHKFYANEVNATLVEVKYILQTLSMADAPQSALFSAGRLFTPWLIEHEVTPGTYLDPVQVIPISFKEFIDEPRSVQSGHLIPLDREGTHVPDNTFLMLFRSNQIQGNLKVAELLKIMGDIVARHAELKEQGSKLETLIETSSKL